MSTKNKGKGKAGAAPAATGTINVNAMVQRARAGIPQQMHAMYDKVVLQGLRLMFDKQSHGMTLEQLDKPGPMAPKLAQGIVGLMYMLWKESNQTIPPQLMVPVAFTLVLRAFEFLQESKDPEATNGTLGEATALAVQGILDGFGATQDRLPSLLKGQKGAQPGTGPGKGMLSAGGAR